ncbi:Dihydroneopterin aldolase/epimerase domain containing protein [Oxalobacteraceae bacterium]
MTTTAFIELRDLELSTDIGTYSPGDIIPTQHLLDLTLWIDSTLVLISSDLMASVFDYDPLIVEIDRLARDGHYETQERLMTRIVEACAKYIEIESIEIGLKKLPVRSGTGSLGVRLSVDSATLNKIRSSTTSA